MEISNLLPHWLVMFSVRSVLLLGVPMVLCFIASTIGLRLMFLQFGFFLVGFLMASCVPLPDIRFTTPSTSLACFACCYVLVLMMIVSLPRVMSKDADRRRQMAVIIVLFLAGAFALRWIMSRQLVL